MLPFWNGASPTIKPFAPWLALRGQSAPNGIPLPWYQAYNASKHDRQQAFKEANLWNLIQAVAALLIVITAQFKNVEFDASPEYWIGSGTDHPFGSSIGHLFRLKVPDDWADDELYDFDWSELKEKPIRFQKIDYDSIIS